MHDHVKITAIVDSMHHGCVDVYTSKGKLWRVPRRTFDKFTQGRSSIEKWVWAFLKCAEIKLVIPPITP
jgi:hypothetical protein